MDRDAWLNQVVEEALEPDRPICDTHHHLWDRPGSRYLVEDFVADAVDHHVVSSVFVECMAGYREEGPEGSRPVGETVFIDELAEACAADGSIGMECCAAIVGYADLRLGGDVKGILEAHLEASPKRFRGTRHGVGVDTSPDVPWSHTKPKPGLLLDSTFRKGFACLGELGLLFESYLYHTQLQELVDLARVYPEQTIVLNHFGGPLGVGPYDIGSDEVWEVWNQSISDLAACENVVAKLGGIIMPRNGFGFHERALPPTSMELAKVTRRFYLHTIDAFGPDRCMFESNFPVEKQSCSYTVLWNSFKRIVTDFSEAEKDEMFLRTAQRVYGIG